MQWTALTSEEKFASLLEQSNIKPILIFKHSTRCSISAMAKRAFEFAWPSTTNTEVYFLDLIAYRSVSNLIAEKLSVVHQSPQVLLIKDGKCIYNASHEDLNASYISTLV
jgi:bacillithiol system protein YtxJ